MFCPRCSKEIEDGSRFCNHCGYEIVPEANSVKEPEPREASAAEEEQEPIVSHSALESQYGLKWYKFLIWFDIWATALTNLVATVAYFTVFNPSMRVTMWFSVIVCVLNAVYLLFVRQALARWKTYGPRLYLISFVIPLVRRVLTIVVANIEGGSALLALNRTDFTNLILNVVLFIVNFIYFRNRAPLFTE
ncbi:MAG: zinc ribbon domain-containing protein [Clostridia bacterium]|nr:zinc ribbon domain-containing protein [Clostridia bacterium]MCR4906622.1 zinc ribbon domain-containing protein [Clostridiales bacterium]